MPKWSLFKLTIASLTSFVAKFLIVLESFACKYPAVKNSNFDIILVHFTIKSLITSLFETFSRNPLADRR